MLLALDLDGVLCDIGPGVAARVASRFGVESHPDTWRSYDLRHLGLPEEPFRAFLDGLWSQPDLYAEASPCAGAAGALRQLAAAGWRVVGVTARAPHLAPVTSAWVDAHGLPLEGVHHTPFGTKSRVVTAIGATAAIEDNAEEAELLGRVCDSWLLDRPYNVGLPLTRARRLRSWDDAVGRLCQLRLFA